MPRYSAWIQDDDITVDLDSPAAIRAAFVALGRPTHPNWTTARDIRRAPVEGTGSLGDAFFNDPAGGPIADFADLVSTTGDAHGLTPNGPIGLAVSSVENDIGDPDRDHSVPPYASDIDDLEGPNPLGEVDIGTTGVPSDPGGVYAYAVQTALNLSDVGFFVDWSLPFFDWPDGATDIQFEVDGVIYTGNSAFTFDLADDCLLGPIALTLQFKQTSRDHYAWFAAYEVDDDDNFRRRFAASTDATAVSYPDVLEIRQEPGAPGFVPAPDIPSLPLVGSVPVPGVGTGVPPAAFNGPDPPNQDDPQTVYDFTNAADETTLTVDVEADTLRLHVRLLLESHRTATGPTNLGMGPTGTWSVETGMHAFTGDDTQTWQPALISYAAVDKVNPDDDGNDPTVASIAFTWRPPRYRFVFPEPVYVRQRQAGSPVRQRQSAMRAERQRQQRR